MLSGMLLLASCGSTTVSGVADSACLNFKLIHWRDADTDTTIFEVKEHNKVWKALCSPSP